MFWTSIILTILPEVVSGQAPTISGFSPTSACSGSGIPVIIDGTNFFNVISVTFNGVNASFDPGYSPTQITAFLPLGATTGYIIVTTQSGSGTSDPNVFSIYPQPTGPTLLAKSPNLISVCEGQTVSATFNSGSGGVGCSDSFQFSTDNGTTWNSYNPGTNINTSGATVVLIQGKRDGCTPEAGCTGTTFTTLASWNVNPQPTGPTLLAKSPNLASVCEGQTVSATFNSGSGGVGCSDSFQFSTDNGTTWNSYNPGTNINTSGANVVLIQGKRDGCTPVAGCTGTTFTTLVSWNVNPQPTGPTLLAKSPNLASVCEGQTVSATFNSGSGGIGCSDSFQFSTDNGTTWNSYNPGTNINTSGATVVLIQGKRDGCTPGAGCTGTTFTTLASWNVNPQPTGPTLLAKSPNLASVCEGQMVSATFNPGSGGVGCSDSFQFSTDNGTTWNSYNPGTNINTSGATVVLIQGKRDGCTPGAGCTGTTFTTLASWNVNPQPTGPTLLAISPNLASVCEGQMVSATFNSGSGGVGCSDSFQFSTDNGTTWNSYNPGTNINTSGATVVLIQGKRDGCTPGAGCTGTTFTTLASWNVNPQPTGPTLLAKSPNLASVCEGQMVSATFNPGSGGVGCSDSFQFSTDNGTTWNSYNPGTNINTSGATVVVIQGKRDGCTPGAGCTGTTFTTLASWNVNPQPTGPTLLAKSPNLPSVCEGQTVSATFNPGSGGVGCSDSFQFSIDNGTTWNSYTSGTTINTVGATVVLIQGKRDGCTPGAGCTGTTFTTLASWNVNPQPTGPTLLAKSPNLASVCEGQMVSATFNPGSGGVGCSDSFQFSIDNGTTWNSYTPGTTINTVGATVVLIQGKRDGCTSGAGCTGTTFITLASWTVNPQPTGPTLLAKSPNLTSVCEGQTVSATFNPGSGGVGCSDSFQFSTDNGTTWNSYNPGTTINTAGATVVLIQGKRDGCTPGAGCIGTPFTTLASWIVNLVNAGVIAADQHICFGGDPLPFSNDQSGTGTGTITYQWQFSPEPFTIWYNISLATGLTYDPPDNQYFTYKYRRITISTYSGVSCMDYSNELTVTVHEQIFDGGIQSSQVICYNESPNELTSIAPGPPGATYEWQKSINGGYSYTTIGGATGETYSPGPLIQTTLFRRRTIIIIPGGQPCYSDYTQPVTIEVMPPVTSGGIKDNQVLCYGDIPAPLTSTQNGSCPPYPISYQWWYSYNGTDWVQIAGATTNNYTPTDPHYQNTWYRRITVATHPSGKQCFSSPTAPVKITVNEQVLPGEIQTDQTICFGEIPDPLTNYISGSGCPTPVYSWQYSINGGTTWTLITGASGSGYSPGALTQTTLYRRITTCTVNNKSCSAISDYVVITVQAQIIAPDAYLNQTICYNTAPNPALSRTIPNPSYNYYWQVSTDNITFSDVTPPQTGTTYQPGNLTATRYYRVRTILGNCGPVFSDTVKITVRPEFITPVICCSQFFCAFNDPYPLTITMPSTGYGDNVIYQWQRRQYIWYFFFWAWTGWQNIDGATGPTYSPPQEIWRTQYRLRVYDNGCTNVWKTSNAIEISFGLSLSGTFSQWSNPEGPYCPETNFIHHIESVNIEGIFLDRQILYDWEVDPQYISTTSVPPIGYQDPDNEWIWMADIQFTTHNNTENTITTTITILPSVYEEDGSLVCNLSPESYDITIYPFLIECPEDITANILNSTECNTSVTTDHPSFIGDCEYETINWDMTGATENEGTGYVGTQDFNKGQTTVIYTAINSAGTETTCSFNVNVFDLQPPEITCPQDTIVNTDPDECTAMVDYDLPTVFENCGEYTISQIGGTLPGGIFPLGITSNTFIATDVSGNKDTCSFTIEVIDVQDPYFISCPPYNQTYTADEGLCSKSFTPEKPEIFDNCSIDDDIELTWSMEGAIIASSGTTGINFIEQTEFPVGTTYITYKLSENSGEPAECFFTITIIDDQPPIIECPESPQIRNVDIGFNYYTAQGNEFDPLNANDNCSGFTLINNLTGASSINGFEFPIDTTLVVWYIIDASNNKDTCSFYVIVLGTTDLSITKSAHPNPALTGGELVYTITVTNNGPAYATNVVISDNIFVLPSPQYSTDSVNWFTWVSPYTLGDLVSGNSDTIYIKGIVPINFCDTITNIAKVSSDTGDDNLDNNEIQIEIPVIDDQPPTIAPPPENPEFCVLDIYSALYDGQPEPDADIIPEFPFPPPAQDSIRPEWYIIEGSLELDLDTLAITDNCCDPVEIISIMTWTITYDINSPYGPITGIGQPSTYDPDDDGNIDPIWLWGSANGVDWDHTITYKLIDCNNPYLFTEVSRTITIKPRPVVIKQY